LRSYPFVKLLETHPDRDTTRASGAGVARNVGITHARTPLLFFLDADDWLIPTALEKMVNEYVKVGGGRYIYSDWFKAEVGQPIELMPCPEYSQEAVSGKIQHAVSVLIEADQVRKVGGFDEDLASWEDWDFSLRLAAAGFCGHRLAEPLLIYRTATGTRRQKAFELAETLMSQIKDRWKGVKFMGCCGGNAQQVQPAQAAIAQSAMNSQPVQDGKIRLQYVGAAKATATFMGKYRAAADGVNEFIDAEPQDVDRLLQLGVFRVA
jgi:hypothetical protein